MSEPELAISTTGLTKRFRGRAAVDGIDLEVPTGSVFGFLGPNGSGKTTTIRMLLGLVLSTAGTATVLGHDMPRDLGAALPRVGALVEGPAMHGHLSGRRNLLRLDAFDATADPATRRARVETALERVGLQAAAEKAVKAYSLGMKQRLGIAAAMLMPHDLLILDEPTNGLDPQGTREVRHLVSSLANDGTTVLVSSHLLSEVEQMCTHVGVMGSGRLLTQGRLDDLQHRARPQVRLDTPDTELALPVLARAGVDSPTADGHHVTGAVPDGVAPEEVVRALVEAQVRVRGFAVEAQRLEDLFVELTGEGFNVA